MRIFKTIVFEIKGNKELITYGYDNATKAFEALDNQIAAMEKMTGERCDGGVYDMTPEEIKSKLPEIWKEANAE